MTNIVTSMVVLCGLLVAVSGCAAGYSPPAERRAADDCRFGEVWVCEDRYPSRIETEDAVDSFCRCEDPNNLR